MATVIEDKINNRFSQVEQFGRFMLLIYAPLLILVSILPLRFELKVPLIIRQ
jgi:hypothetical protein